MIVRTRDLHPLTPLLAAALSLGIGITACGGHGAGRENGTGSGDDGGLGDASGGSVFGGTGGSLFGSADGGVVGSAEGGNGGAPSVASFPCQGCAPFPSPAAPSCAPTALGPPTLVYPADGILLPPNMNVLEVQWVPPAGASLFEVDFENGATDVRVETMCNPITTVRGTANIGCGLTLSQEQWRDIANTNRDGAPVTVAVRATTAAGPCVATSQQSVQIAFAKDDLTGGIYYWQSATFGGVAGRTGGIFFHDFGTFDSQPTPFYTSGGTGTCVGCHTLSKDGARMALMTDDPDADDEYGDVKMHVMDVASRTVLGGQNVGPGFQTFTHDHKMMIASTFKPGMIKPIPGMMGGAMPDSVLAVWNGDGTMPVTTNALPSGMQGTQPNLSWDDKRLVFVAPAKGTISTAGDHHFTGGSLWSAAFDPTSGALSSFASMLASDGTQNFFYPDQSVDGNWVVFNEADDTSAANNTNDCFYNRKARVKMVHIPLQAGDQPLDLGRLNVADGLSNSWPRWSPALTSYKGKKVLWVTFSSNRDYGLHLKNTSSGYPTGSPGFDNYYPPESPMYDQPQPASKQGVTFDAYASPQIWMAAVVVDPDRSLDGTDRSYEAFWLPFQDVTAHNHSAQWVAQVQGSSATGAGADDAGTEGGTACQAAGAACGAAGGLCCSDVVCCSGSCQYSCAQ
jgi:hypothetical protein